MEGSIIKDPKVPNSTVPANFCCGWPKVLIYWRQGKNAKYEWALECIPKYYSDHDALCLTLWEK